MTRARLHLPDTSPSRLLLIGWALACFAAAAGAFAQAPPAGPTPTDGWHVIRPGDTLEGLAQRYLGSRDRWQEIYRLNPQIINDPHWIFPGRRIRVAVDRPAAAHAQISALARRVEERPEPVSWRDAASGDLLLERDGIRTYAGASAHLRFDDGTSATLSEDSLVFIRRQSPPSAKTARKEIEIELGQADLSTAARSASTAPEIEILVDGARNRATPDAGGKLATRSRRTPQGAQFMQYAGSGEVSASGQRVELAAGTGTVVASHQPPAPAEALLPAPGSLEPSSGGELGRDEPLLSWSAVAGAASYTVEVCADEGCGAVVERRTGLTATEARLAQELPAGGGFWRVNAVAASGLDGFPTPLQRFESVDSVLPPAPRLTLTTPEGAELSSGACVSEAPGIQVDATDRRRRELAWSLRVNGEDVRAESADAFPESGDYEVVALARDERGRTSSSAPLRFALDRAAPSIELPPTPGGAPIPTPDSGRRVRLPKPVVRAIPPCDLGLEVSAGGEGPWLPVACGTTATEPTRLPLDGTSATLEVRARGTSLRVGEVWPLAAGQTISLSLGDRGCGLVEARLRLEPSPFQPGRVALEVEVDDAAGLTSRQLWHVDPYPAPR